MLRKLFFTIFFLHLLLLNTFPQQLDSLLLDAIRSDDLIKVKELVQKGVNVNLKYTYTLDNGNEFFNYPLHIAADSGFYEIAEFLLEKGADVNSKDRYGDTPLYLSNSAEIASLLIANGADIQARDSAGGYSPLDLARNAQIAKLLIEKGSDINAKSYSGYTPLHLARTVEIASLLIEKGADINAKSVLGTTPLNTASNSEIALFLIEKGADLNSKDEDGNSLLVNNIVNINRILNNLINSSHSYDTNYYIKSVDRLLNVSRVFIEKGSDINSKTLEGNTLLLVALESDHPDFVKWLIDHGANVNSETSDGTIPLMVALEKNRPGIVRLLIEKGADENTITSLLIDSKFEEAASLLNNGFRIDFRNDDDQTAMIRVVVESTNTDALRFLLDNKADPFLKDIKGKTALDYAILLDKKNFVDLLSVPVLIQTLQIKGEKAVIELLKKDTTGISQMDNRGFTLMHYLVLNKCDTLLNYITSQLKNTSLLNVLNREHQTPLMYAIYVSDPACASRLVEAGADVNIEDHYGETPLYLAEKREMHDLVTRLKMKKAVLKEPIYPTELSVPMNVTLGIVYYVMINPDGKNFLLSDYISIRLWDINTGKELRTYSGYNKGISISPDGRSFLSLSSEGCIKQWDITTGKEIKHFEGYENGAYSFCFSPDGKSFLSAIDSTIRLRDIATGKEIRSFTGHTDDVTRLTFSPDGKYFISETIPFFHFEFRDSLENPLKLWEVSTGKEIKGFISQKGWVNKWSTKINFSPDGKTFIYGCDVGIIKLCDAATGKEIRSFSGKKELVSSICFSPDGKTFAAGYDYGSISLWDISSGNVIRSYSDPSEQAITDIKFLPDGKSFISACYYGGSMKQWDINNGFELKSFEGHSRGTNSVDVSNKGKEILVISGSEVKLVNTTSLQEIRTYIDKELQAYTDNGADIRSACFSPDGKSFLTSGSDMNDSSTLKLWDIASGNELRSFPEPNGYYNTLRFADDGKTFFSGANSFIKHWDVASGRGLDSSSGTDFHCFSFTSDGKIWIFEKEEGVISVWDNVNGNELKSLKGHDGEIKSLCFSPDNKAILSGGIDKTLRLWDVATGLPIRTFTGHSFPVTDVKFHPSGKYLVSCSYDNTIKFWNIETTKEIASFVFIDSLDYVFYTPDKYYAATKNGAKALGWVKGTQVWNFDQWDLQYNRPDIVFGRMPDPDTAMIKLYYKAYQKRLKKMKFSESMFKTGFHTPEIQIEKQARTAQNMLELDVSAIDTLYSMDRINVWVNDVPVFGINGISLRNEKQSAGVPVKKQISLALGEGDNKIEISVLNSAGAESLKQTAYAKNENPSVKKDLYFIAISCADYKDNRYNLKYSVKDGRDMAKQFAASGSDFTNIFIDTLFNKNVTRENVAALKGKLLKTKVDDEIILFASGHGLLDDSLDFYFASYDIDFRHPERRGISFDDFENIMDSIPARKKLFMMDACHSGEVDKDEMGGLTASNAVKTTSDIAFRGNVKEYETRGADVATQPGVTLNNSFELMQELFAGLDKGTGTTVISAAAGKGYALESPQWDNGVFTYSIINGLKNHAADRNKDGTISISELKDYSIKEVQLLTDGQQKPTARRESINYDWKIW